MANETVQPMDERRTAAWIGKALRIEGRIVSAETLNIDGSVEGTIEVTIFPELFKQSATHLRSGSPLLVRGKVEGTTTARKLLADDIRPLPADADRGGEGATPLPRTCRVAVPPNGSSDPLPALRAICEAHRGTVPLALRLRVDGEEVDVRSRTLRVRPSAAFVEAVEGLLGPGSVTVEA